MNKEIQGFCHDYTHDGQGIVRYEGKPIFVDGLFLNEEAIVEITYVRPDYSYGKIKKLIKLSPDRITPRCPVATACGGCQFQALAYPAQLQFKKRKVEEALRKIGGLSVKVDEVVGMDNPYFYRNKTQMPIGLDNKKRIISGFYRKNTHAIVPIDTCYIEDERANGIIKKIKLLMKEHKIEPYQEDERFGVIRHVLIKTSKAYDEIMLVLVTNADSFPGRGNLVNGIKKECPEITTIVQNINTRSTNVILGEKENILFGKGFIKDKLGDFVFNISSKSFYQVNPVQTEKMYNIAIEKAGFKGTETIIDAYCGVGTIGLFASRHVKEVYAVDIVKEAIDDAKRNARNNNVNNIKFYAQDAVPFIKDVISEKLPVDAVIVDPPRKGLEEEFVKSLLDLKPNKIIYISCEPATLARDLKMLSTKYDVKSVTPVDMFPQTFHVETIVLLFLK